MSDEETLLELRGISKRFGATVALDDVDLEARPGEVHALIGENGAGKSTLMKILSGAYRPDEGKIIFEGKEVSIDFPLTGRRMGIAMIYQELNLAPHLTVEENITLGMEESTLGFVRSQQNRLKEVLQLLHHHDLPLDERVGDLGIGVQQIVEIARALASNARVIIMDEPTSSLSAGDIEALFEVIGRLREQGYAIIYISHFLEETTRVADRYTVLRDGKQVGTGLMSETDIPQIIRLMIGRSLDEMFPRVEHESGDMLLKVQGLKGTVLPQGVDFELHRGEILGIAGLVGAGRSEALRSLFGLRQAEAGTAEIARKGEVKVAYINPRRALSLGVDFLSEDRKQEGLATNLTVADNVTLSSLPRFASLGGWGLLDLGKEARAVRHWIGEVNILCRGPDQKVMELSGGNQQKVALARLLAADSDVFLLDEPTRGIDVGTKVEIYRMMGELAAQGKGVVFVSSYLPELLGVCDTLAVMHKGKLSPVRPVDEWTQEEVMEIATTGN